MMHKPSEQEFNKAKELLLSKNLEYEAAIICVEIVKAFIWDEEVPHDYISQLQEFQYGVSEKHHS